MAEAALPVVGALLMLVGVALLCFLAFAEFSRLEAVRWYERRPLLLALALACILLGGSLASR